MLAECVTKYFVESKDGEESDDDNVGRGYKCVLNSKTTEESLVNIIIHKYTLSSSDKFGDPFISHEEHLILQANFARWEPPHGRFFFRYPWKLYVKVGSMTRYCAYCVEALNGLLNSEIQVMLVELTIYICRISVY